jgi:hypothetical protein
MRKTKLNKSEQGLKEPIHMGKAIAVVLLIAATLVLISLTVFSDQGAFGDAKTQRDRASQISDTITVPTALP